MKNAYAAKLQTNRIRMKNNERAELIHRILITVYQASAVALNEQFGFGADRIARFRDSTEHIIIEYGALLDSADAEYADCKLEQRYKRIMNQK